MDTSVETPEGPAKKKPRGPFVSPSGVTLDRTVSFQFALDPNQDQRILFAKCAGARRYCFNHHIGRVKENLDLRAAEKEALTEANSMTPGLSWRAFSFINEMNAWKNGKLTSSPENEDGTRGLSWHREIPADVFECASNDAAAALKNWTDSKNGVRKGAAVGFPKFSAKNRSVPSFRLRNKDHDGDLPSEQPIRFTDTSHLHLPKIGAVKVLGSTKKVRRMLDGGRFHIYSVTITLRGGRWIVSLTGVAAQFHPARRSVKGRHPRRVGIDRGIKSLAVVADTLGELLANFEGVNELQSCEARLIMAQKALARTTPGSKGHAKAKATLNKRHRQVAVTRKHLVHQVSLYLVTHCTSLVLEDLDVAAMKKDRRRAKAVSDSGMGELRNQIEYKARWYGVEVVIATRWFASSKTCSGCGEVKAELDLSQRTYRCEVCGLSIDRDLNAAINLARWTPHVAPEVPSEVPAVKSGSLTGPAPRSTREEPIVTCTF